MSLLDEAFEDCTFLTPTRTSDGMGGYETVWTDGAGFDAAIVLDTTLQAKIAAKSGVTELYTVTTRKSLNLEFHEVFRRESDKQVFRVTSNGDDKKTPASAGLNMRQVSAEKYILAK